MSNTNSIWFAVDENGIEEWYDQKPKRTESCWWCDDLHNEGVLFPGAIQAITGRTITWADEPLKWKPGKEKGSTPCTHDWDSVVGGRYYCKICDKYFHSED